jgi:hypothetical protein
METVKVLVKTFSQTRGVDLTVNGRQVRIPLGKATPVDAELLPALKDAGVEFEIVTDEDKAAGPAKPEPQAEGTPAPKPVKKSRAPKA